jgi:hypothetical protein
MSDAAATFNALRHVLEAGEVRHAEAGGFRDNGSPAKGRNRINVEGSLFGSSDQ